MKLAVVLSLVFGYVWSEDGPEIPKSLQTTEPLKYSQFPDDFKFGIATAAFQIEGATDKGGRGESIWDRFVKIPGAIYDGSNADIACDSYHKWQTDVDNIKHLGVYHYRFSISWTRILPEGFINKINQEGVDYYNNLINGLIKEGIEPMVTMYHWDMPQKMQEYGGWVNPLITDWFADYADLLFKLYGDRVKYWVTMNEPLAICDMAYNIAKMPPATNDPNRPVYHCNKNLLIAHAKAYRLYDYRYREKQNGKISMAHLLLWYEPGSNSRDDIELAELSMDYANGRYLHPIYSKTGGWPRTVEATIGSNSWHDGYNSSRLPAFTNEEIELIRGTSDYLGLNYYTAKIPTRVRKGEAELIAFPMFAIPELGIKMANGEESQGWIPTIYDLIAPYPKGLRRTIDWFRKLYNKDMPIIITENGFPGQGGPKNDEISMRSYRAHLAELLLSIHEDKANVIGYTAWSLMDNFEWMEGYKTKFGLYEVDFKDPERPRTIRKLGNYYKSIVAKKSLDIDFPAD